MGLTSNGHHVRFRPSSLPFRPPSSAAETCRLFGGCRGDGEGPSTALRVSPAEAEEADAYAGSGRDVTIAKQPERRAAASSHTASAPKLPLNLLDPVSCCSAGLRLRRREREEPDETPLPSQKSGRPERFFRDLVWLTKESWAHKGASSPRPSRRHWELIRASSSLRSKRTPGRRGALRGSLLRAATWR